jgi:hypothetical protein
MSCDVVLNGRRIARELATYWTGYALNLLISIDRFHRLVVYGIAAGRLPGLSLLRFARPDVGIKSDLLCRLVQLSVQAHIGVAPSPASKVSVPLDLELWLATVERLGILRGCLDIQPAVRPRLLAGSCNALHSTNPAVSKANFDAPRMIASGQELLHDALHRPAGRLVGLKHDINSHAKPDLCG